MTAPAPASFEWRWVDIGGQQHKLRFEELAQALSRGRLPIFTLIWRTQWLEWVPAANVPELSAAIGVRRAGAPIVARTDPGAIAPPSPPLAHYATSVPKGTLTLERGETPAPRPARAPVRTQKGLAPPSDPPPVVGPPVPLRNVMPTLSEDGQPARSNTLRPTGALPPPPRNVPSPKRPPFSSIPPVGTRPGVPPAAPPRAPVPPPPASIAPGLTKKAEPSNGAASPRVISSAPPPPSSRRKAAERAAAAAGATEQPARPAAKPPEPKKAAGPERERLRVAEAQVPPRAVEAPHLPKVIITPLPPPPESGAPPESEPSAPIAATTALAAPADSAPAPTTPLAASLSEPPTPRRAAPVPSPRATSREPMAAAADEQPAGRRARRFGRRTRDDEEVAGLSRRTITVLSSAGVLIPGVVLLVAALLKPRHRPPETVVTPPTPSVTAAAPVPPPGCAVEKPAQRIAEAAYLAVPTLVATAPDGSHAAVGFAATKEHALGLSIDPATLATNTVFEQTVTGSTTLSVVPLVRSGVLEFVVDRADANLSSARTVDAEKRFTIAVTGDAVSRIVGPTKDVVWPRSAQGSAMTTPRVAFIPKTGYAVVFREGGQEGNVLVGQVREDGSKLTELTPIKAEAALVGTPAVGTSGDGVLVGFAAKATAADPWHVELAAGTSAEAPRQSHAFTVPPGGPGGEAISPAIEGLGDGRFLLQWTEGSAGNRAVRAQLVTADLVSIGDPVTLSSADQNAGQGTLWLKENRAVALFLVQKEAAHELWAASLRCQ